MPVDRTSIVQALVTEQIKAMSQDSLGAANSPLDFTRKSLEEQSDYGRELIGDKEEFAQRAGVFGPLDAPEAEVKAIAQKIDALI
jgi:hypothetical protein